MARWVSLNTCTTFRHFINSHNCRVVNMASQLRQIWYKLLFWTRPKRKMLRLIPIRDRDITVYRVDDYARNSLIVWKGFTANINPQQTDDNDLFPPKAVCGMKHLNRELFTKTVQVPSLKVKSKLIQSLTESIELSKFKLLKTESVAELSKDDPMHETHKLLLLNPKKYKTPEDFSSDETKMLENFCVDVKSMIFCSIDVGYDNWMAAQILRAVLPKEAKSSYSYLKIGHIAQLDLKPEVMDYRHLIGEVLLDKNHSIKTVVIKLGIIGNTFRTFPIEHVAGEPTYITRVKENNCFFEFDFSKVFWNPELVAEHQHVVDLLQKGDVLYDVFAGVGPFSIPAAKKLVTVMANDLNPDSYSALVKNTKLNEINPGLLQAFQLDGREFIRTVVKPDLVQRLEKVSGTGVREMANKATISYGLSRDASEMPMSGSDILNKDPSSTERTGLSVFNQDSSRNVKPDLDISSFGVQEGKLGSCSILHATHDDLVTVPDTQSSNDIVCQPGCHGDNTDLHADFKISDISVGEGRKQYQLYIVMNLPSSALEFLDVFSLLLVDCPKELKTNPDVHQLLPTVLCYCFNSRKKSKKDLRSRAETVLRQSLPKNSIVHTVRTVSPHKKLMCLVLPLTPAILFGTVDQEVAALENSQEENRDDDPLRKRSKM